MDSVKLLLILGNHARPADAAKSATQDSIRQAFLQCYTDQLEKLVSGSLQIWDMKWSHWVDITTEQVTLVDGCKLRFIPKYDTRRKLGNLTAETCAFFCCDMQERFRPAIAHFEDITLVSKRLLEGAYALDIPVFVTEQYPRGLLHTVPELDISKAKAVVEKTIFSMMVPELEMKLQTVQNLQSVVLFGVEAHVCIQQTALDLLARGIGVHVIADATSSRSDIDRQLAFNRLRCHDAIITTAESVLLQLVKDKNHPKFKEIQGLIKVTPPQKGIMSCL